MFHFIPLFVSVFMAFINKFTHALLRTLGYLKSLSCASAMLHFLGPIVGLPSFSGDTVLDVIDCVFVLESRLGMIVSLC